ncbi:MAG TPA: right-handed parallel beta-helix repeat-containing protein [Parvularculaceae bacterium]|nr:right-handed parallel beta-helix repeat-containing protein [Parvularculaceae bacterium]
MKYSAPLLALSLLIPACALAAPKGDSAALIRSIETAKKGATVTVPAGEYDIADVKIPKDINLVGQGEVVFYSSRKLEKGLLVPGWDASLRVENITFEDAVSYDDNGAGIRNDGLNLTVINCRFINDQDGILATGRDEGKIEIVHSEFIGSGAGDGYSHGIYVSSGHSLAIKDSRFVGTRYGHHVKSLADITTITGSTFDDADGHTSYAVDASRGGAVTITGNSFLKAADADNNALFNYDLTRGGKAISLTISGNKIVNRRRGAILLRNPTALKPVIKNNRLANEGRGQFAVD